MFADDESIAGYGRKMILNNYFLNNTVNCAASNDGAGIVLYKTLATLGGNYFGNNAVIGTGGVGGVGSAFRTRPSVFKITSSRKIPPLLLWVACT